MEHYNNAFDDYIPTEANETTNDHSHNITAFAHMYLAFIVLMIALTLLIFAYCCICSCIGEKELNDKPDNKYFDEEIFTNHIDNIETSISSWTLKRSTSISISSV